jgi:hypothetical protein
MGAASSSERSACYLTIYTASCPRGITYASTQLWEPQNLVKIISLHIIQRRAVVKETSCSLWGINCVLRYYFKLMKLKFLQIKRILESTDSLSVHAISNPANTHVSKHATSPAINVSLNFALDGDQLPVLRSGHSNPKTKTLHWSTG